MIDQMGTVWRISPWMAVVIGLGLVALGAVVSGIIQFKRGVQWQVMKEPEIISKNIALQKENDSLCVEARDYRVFMKTVELAKHDFNEKSRSRK